MSTLTKAIKELFSGDTAGGAMLMLAAILAMIVVNTGLSPYYNALLHTHVEIRMGEFGIDKPLLLWINDGLMAVFFFLVGLELKREILTGELSEPARVMLPTVAAIGGMAMPAVIYSLINMGDSMAMKGWAIPSATDIAFALGVLALLGSRVPSSLKLFLMALAIIDDLGAIIIIALFYTSDLSVTSLYIAAVAISILFILNRSGVLHLAPYLLVGLILWAAVLKSGVHATLAGVITALFIPNQKADDEHHTQLELMEHDLHSSVYLFILPVFAFANAGISFAGMTIDALLHPVPIGIAAGLFFGNQIGVFGFSWVAIKLGLAPLPQGARWSHLYGVSLLCGIGFTMSLFISSLAFAQGGEHTVNDRLGIMIGSLLSGVVGYFVLSRISKHEASSDPKAAALDVT